MNELCALRLIELVDQMSTAAAPLSLNKHKRWEALDELHKGRPLAQSYSDTDDISDESEDGIDTGDRDELLLRADRTAVLTLREIDHDGRHREDLIQDVRKKVVHRFIQQKELDAVPAPEEDPETRRETYAIQGRKGFTIKHRRPKGKRVVKQTSPHSHAASVYDLASASTLVVVTEPLDVKEDYKLRKFKEHEFPCYCRVCTYSETSRVAKNKDLQRQMLSQL